MSNPFPKEDPISPMQVLNNMAARGKERIESGFVDKEEEIARVRSIMASYAQEQTIKSFSSVTTNAITGVSTGTLKRIKEREGNYAVMTQGIRRPLYVNTME